MPVASQLVFSFAPPSLVPKVPRHPPTKGQEVVSTKVGRHKLPPSVRFVPINEIPFHYEDSVHKRKYVVQHRIADELTISN